MICMIALRLKKRERGDQVSESKSMVVPDRPEDITGRPEWTVLRVDPRTGEQLEQEALAERERIRSEAQQGFVAVDGLYSEVQHAIHQPLVGEHGQVKEDVWLLHRANSTILSIQGGAGLNAANLEEIAITIARAAIDEFAAEVMVQLYALANDPPNWRRPDFTVRLSELLDRLGFRRDDRGIHQTRNRRRLTTTLLALHLTAVGVQRRAARKGGGNVGFLAPLLSSVGYATRAEVADLSPIEVFEQGLPEEVAVSINPAWYQGVRQRDGTLGTYYSLIPRAAPQRGIGRPRKGRRSPITDLLREYFLRAHGIANGSPLPITRQALLEIATISDRNQRQASRTLQKALDTLIDEGLLASYVPEPIPHGVSDLITVRWGVAAEVAQETSVSE